MKLSPASDVWVDDAKSIATAISGCEDSRCGQLGRLGSSRSYFVRSPKRRRCHEGGCSANHVDRVRSQLSQTSLAM